METKIENFIKKHFDPRYKICIKKIKYLNDDVIIAEPYINFCSNVNRTHNSSGTYFQIKKTGICQRCFCTKVSSDSGICCKNYFSKEIPLSNPLKSLLFKKSKQQKNNNKIIPFINLKSKINTIKNCKSFLEQLELEIINNNKGK